MRKFREPPEDRVARLVATLSIMPERKTSNFKFIYTLSKKIYVHKKYMRCWKKISNAPWFVMWNLNESVTKRTEKLLGVTTTMPAVGTPDYSFIAYLKSRKTRYNECGICYGRISAAKWFKHADIVKVVSCGGRFKNNLDRAAHLAAVLTAMPDKNTSDSNFINRIIRDRNKSAANRESYEILCNAPWWSRRSREKYLSATDRTDAILKSGSMPAVGTPDYSFIAYLKGRKTLSEEQCLCLERLREFSRNVEKSI